MFEMLILNGGTIFNILRSQPVKFVAPACCSRVIGGEGKGIRKSGNQKWGSKNLNKSEKLQK